MRIAILESIVMPAGHEVEFDRILVEELKKQGHEPVFFVPEHFPFKLDYHCDVEYLAGGEAISYAGVGRIKRLWLRLRMEKLGALAMSGISGFPRCAVKVFQGLLTVGYSA